MAKSDKRTKARAARKAQKRARYAARRDLGNGRREGNSPYNLRQRQRANGLGMNPRSHEQRPWWEFGPRPMSKVLNEAWAAELRRCGQGGEPERMAA